jgi:acetyl esterase
VAAGKLLQEKGLVAPDRTVASIAEVRAATDRIGAFLGEGSLPLKNERDLSLPGPQGQVPCRLYLPDGVERPPLLVYAHGGGFMQGSIPSWDHFLRDLVRQSGVAALSVDYKLSPEVKFPVAYEEMVAITRLMAREGAGLGIDASRLAVGGDSAGGNLSLSALTASTPERALIRAAVLFYGAFDLAATAERNRAHAGLQTQLSTYVGGNTKLYADPRVSPLKAVAPGLAPCFILGAGEDDWCLGDSLMLAQALTAAGSPYEMHVMESMPHGFMQMSELEGCRAALRLVWDFLARNV